MLVINLDTETNLRIVLQLVTSVENCKDLHKKIISGELDCCAIKPNLIVDPFQVIVAANKAALNKQRGKLKTKSINSELLFNLSISKNISQSLSTFGIGENDNNILLVVFEDGCSSKFEDMKAAIKGDFCKVSDLNKFSDEKLIAQKYKIKDSELKVSTLLNSVISRIATKDFGSY